MPMRRYAEKERYVMTSSPSVSLKFPDRFFIGGDWVKPSASTTFDVITPSTEELFLRVAEAQEADINRAVAAARAAFDHGPWPRMSHEERAGYLRKIAEKLEARQNELAISWTSEMGITQVLAQSMSHVGSIYESYASLAQSFPFQEQHHPAWGGETGLLVREPVGVVAAIIPWNGPLPLIAIKTAPALLAGCAIVLKASPEAPTSPLIVAEIMEEVGLPAGVFNVITADRPVSELLVRHPDVDKVTFTGSTAAGKKIASICGERIARCSLELGGKSPAIVLNDFDLAGVVEALTFTPKFQTGQACSALTRVIIPRQRHDDLVEGLVASFELIKVGDPFDLEIEMGPLAMRRQRDRVEGYIATGIKEGATLATGGVRPGYLNRGYYLEPTIFANVDNNSTIAREEIFGPVIAVIPAEDEEDAIRLANDTSFGLNASVFTNDVDRALGVARQVRSGTVGHNAWRADLSIAFGGFKQSGVGREGGSEGLLPFLETKTIILNGRPTSFGS